MEEKMKFRVWEMADKLSWILEHHYNLFHADLIERAIFDKDISLGDFICGCVQIGISEKDADDDEFVPDEFKNV